MAGRQDRHSMQASHGKTGTQAGRTVQSRQAGIATRQSGQGSSEQGGRQCRQRKQAGNHGRVSRQGSREEGRQAGKCKRSGQDR
jgi:hypothetical protein